MIEKALPHHISNIIAGDERSSVTGLSFDKLGPVDGRLLFSVTRSNAKDVSDAVAAARAAQPAWADIPPVRRGEILMDIAHMMKEERLEVAQLAALETGKSMKASLGETDGAIQLAQFYASEGQRLYGQTKTSSVVDKYSMTVREPVGIAGLIIAANTPVANVAWKVFPALICGNAAVLKSAEDAPATAWIVTKLAHEAGLPLGVLNLVHGYGDEAGAPLVEHADVNVISFTGSTAVGRFIQRVAGERLAKVSLELGGKNPFVVCDDGDLENAAEWAVRSAFSNAGQRCASGSRIIVFDNIYSEFKALLIDKTRALKIGVDDDDDLGPIINEQQLHKILAALDRAKEAGAMVLSGGNRMLDGAYANGYFLAPTIVERAGPGDEISTTELFGPVTILYKADGFEHALELSNQSPYGLTACIHTASVHRALRYCHRVQAGTTVVNGGTYGSEPHMPFGGVKQSGNGTREPGTEALEVYSSLKTLNINIDTSKT